MTYSCAPSRVACFRVGDSGIRDVCGLKCVELTSVRGILFLPRLNHRTTPQRGTCVVPWLALRLVCPAPPWPCLDAAARRPSGCRARRSL
eukprot:5954993-Alexandrium_andersonii.AAC.1